MVSILKREDIERWGYLRAFHRALMKRLSKWIFLTIVYNRKLDEEAAPESRSEVSVHVVSREELLQAAADNPQLGLSEAFIESALARGDICVAAFVDERLVAYVWRSYSGAPHDDGLWVAFEKPQRYGYKAYTLPEYRGRHLLKNSVTDPICRSRGYSHGVSFVEIHNYASRINNERIGNYRVGYAGYVKIRGRSYPFHTRGVKRIKFRFYRAG